MVNSKKDGKNTGVPRPYSSTDLSTPRQVLTSIISPLKIWNFLLIVILSAYALSASMYYFYNIDFNVLIYPTGFLSYLFSIFISTRKIRGTGRESVPSIENVSRTAEYTAVASRIFIITLIAGLLSILVMVGVHLLDTFSINSITRLTVIFSLLFGFTFSYTIVYTLCSYTPLYEKSFASLPVNISSLPEVVTFFGFILPPSLIIYTGFIYNEPAFLEIPFMITIIDSLIATVSIMIIYIAFVSRL